MVKDQFGMLLEDLGRILQIENLQPDRNECCNIHFPKGVLAQLQIDHERNRFLIGCDLGPIPPGKYRENLFAEALRANGMRPPRHGNFGFSVRKEHLLLTEELPMAEINADRIFQALIPFTEKALIWQEAIQKGELPIVVSSGKSSGMFGLK